MDDADMPLTSKDVAVVVKQRRLSLQKSQRACAMSADVSPTTWASLERGEPVSEMTLVAAAIPLRWPDDWHAQLADGTPAGELPTVDHPEDADPMEKGMAQLLEEFKRGNARLEARIEQLERAVREQGSAPHGQ